MDLNPLFSRDDRIHVSKNKDVRDYSSERRKKSPVWQFKNNEQAGWAAYSSLFLRIERYFLVRKVTNWQGIEQKMHIQTDNAMFVYLR